MKLQIIFSETHDYQRLSPPAQQALQRLLAVAKLSVMPEPVAAVSCEISGVSKQADWPIAAINQLAQGEVASEIYWMHAHPVHLVLQRDYFSLYPPKLTKVTQEESARLVDLLNQHFQSDGLTFSTGKQSNEGTSGFYLRLAQSPEISTTLSDFVVGKDIRPYMPQGAGATKWHAILNEVQMLLHDHPINQEREREGLVPINSIWLSGGGIIQSSAKSATRLYGQSQFAKGVAIMSSNALLALPDDIEAWLKASKEDAIWLMDDISSIGSAGFMQMLSALRYRKIHDLELYFGLQGQVLKAYIKPLDVWRFWRKRQPLANYFNGDLNE